MASVTIIDLVDKLQYNQNLTICSASIESPILMNPPKNYNEMLSHLGKLTFLTTLIFLIVLKMFDVIPMIEVDKSQFPDTKESPFIVAVIFDYVLSFGAFPIIGSACVWLLSSLFELHNKLSKLLLIRYVWEKYFIVRPMLKRVGANTKVNRTDVKKIMRGLYYPKIKEIDEHYIHVFWRYALQFWVIFEHFFVVSVTLIILPFWADKSLPSILIYYWIFIGTVMCLHWLFVVTPKSKDQADQIPEKDIRSFMQK